MTVPAIPTHRTKHIEDGGVPKRQKITMVEARLKRVDRMGDLNDDGPVEECTEDETFT